ncbi:hypothetical protein Salat_0277700 [Sesamum alatum]|uniref:Uncharacterized protein n=1 Tax=Sesamum alatum TaxID=300844 RepID=A0AAE2CYR2_9LAMI|nr:hypothetical protein Salat_0277700 [Sesamum alatum]
MSSSLSKRKLDDYAADDALPVNPTRMRKDQTALPPSSSSSSPNSPLSSPAFSPPAPDHPFLTPLAPSNSLFAYSLTTPSFSMPIPMTQLNQFMRKFTRSPEFPSSSRG